MESTPYSDFDRPSYNIKAVANLVGVLPVTLRAWERRYGFPSPSRGGQGYRLYSEHDLQTLRWLKAQLDAGMNIGQAAQQLHQMRQTGKDPASDTFTNNGHSLSLDSLRARIVSSLKQYNTQGAAEALRQALNLYGLDEVFSDVIESILVQVGEEWHKGQISVSEEHFITEFFQEQLLGMLAGSVKPFRATTIVAGCMPGEYHQIGLLMLVILLRMKGWNVIYLGPNLHLERLDELIRSLNPRLILFSATLSETAAKVQSLTDVMRKIDKPAPIIILGGQGFVEIATRVEIPHTILSGTRTEMIDQMERAIDQRQ